MVVNIIRRVGYVDVCVLFIDYLRQMFPQTSSSSPSTITSLPDQHVIIIAVVIVVPFLCVSVMVIACCLFFRDRKNNKKSGMSSGLLDLYMTTFFAVHVSSSMSRASIECECSIMQPYAFCWYFVSVLQSLKDLQHYQSEI
jgi:hypothetical protein